MTSSELVSSAVERIEIFSRWVGFADPPMHAAKLVISRSTDGTYSREVLPAGTCDFLRENRVAMFMEALARPSVPRLDPAMFDLPPGLIEWHYGSCWTDDSPSHLIVVTLSNGRTIEIRTNSQYAFMLPFQVSDAAGHRDEETFDPRLSRAISSLMPDDYPDQQRMAGSSGMLRWDLERMTASEAPIESPQAGPSPTEAAELLEGVDATETLLDATNSFLESDQGKSLCEALDGLLSDEETPAEKAEAERTGKLSQRLLKRIGPAEVRKLLDDWADPSVADDVGQTALMHAAWRPDCREIFRMLVQAGANVDARRNDGANGLQLACSGGNAEAAEEWIRAGANVEARVPEGATPLMIAATWSEIVRPLLAAGADVHAVDADGDTALVYSIYYQSPYKGESQLEAIRALIAAGSDLNVRNLAGLTPLGQARKVLARVQLDEEVTRAIHPDWKSTSQREWNDLSMARAVIDLIVSAGGRD